MSQTCCALCSQRSGEQNRQTAADIAEQTYQAPSLPSLREVQVRTMTPFVACGLQGLLLGLVGRHGTFSLIPPSCTTPTGRVVAAVLKDIKNAGGSSNAPRDLLLKLARLV